MFYSNIKKFELKINKRHNIGNFKSLTIIRFYKNRYKPFKATFGAYMNRHNSEFSLELRVIQC